MPKALPKQFRPDVEAGTCRRGGHLKIAVLVKQVPRVEDMTLGEGGRLQREGIELEMNAYCRRAVSKGVELAHLTAGRCVVFTLGPPSAEDVFREAVAWGADEGVLVSDPAFAGSDTFATARALVAALAASGPWDLIFAGRNSIDADTGQVGPEVAQLLDLPFAAGVRELTITDEVVRARCELDDGWRTLEVSLPAVLSVAERLTEPCKVPAQQRAEVPPERISTLRAADLGRGPWGAAGSPTVVGAIRTMEIERRRLVLSGSVPKQVAEAVRLLQESGAIERRVHADESVHAPGAEPAVDVVGPAGKAAPDGPIVAVVVEPERARVARELLGEAVHLARSIGGAVVAVGPELPEPPELASWGADAAASIAGVQLEEDISEALARWCESVRPWGVLAPGTLWGREVAGCTAARLGAGLTGDAVGLGVESGRLVAWKPAFGGRLVAAVTASSEVQLATVRPGVLSLRGPRSVKPDAADIRVDTIEGTPRGRVRVTGSERQDEVEALLSARAVVAVGAGVSPEEYGSLDPLLKVLDAELAASRKVTDRGWLSRARQVGITGHIVDPAVYVAIGISGKFNHMVGSRSAGTVIAINRDPEAPVFEWVDVGIVADWHDAVPLLVRELE